MLMSRWYLTAPDWFAELPDASRLGDDGQTVISQFARVLHDEPPVGPAETAAVMRVALLAVEQLGEAMTHAAECHDLTELARLLCGLNLVQAHLTQTIQRISLSTAGINGEILAGHLKDAHLILRSVAVS
ncbi:hypothetical protein C5N14_28405 [Micromonospora sp. MW-13]|uniref:hypothetical protein n=1 Tax=Micromonospora sp. MW-13 TaxID=2094022 RepID=UPI000ED68C92|nr:hypothetical protein [Micromonospora sp. MW-13]RGC65529.1 hypothetical protein C5N14_28405 [Micromonospora sp. MW-13]